MATLTPEAKQLLARTIRDLRARLLQDLHDAAEGRYRLSLPLEKARLPEELRKKRERLEAWLDERVRSAAPKDGKAAEAARARFLAEAQKEAAATLLNRLVLLRHLEALGLSRPAVVTEGWTSKGYQELRDFAPALCGDETEGYAALLQLVFDELALDLPGLFGDVGLTRLFPVPPATLREVVQRLDDPGLLPAWTDDTTLGWVYQYWNDPEREALDAKLNDGGKIEPHEIASKTQMFTERYMVEWLLQNSLGLAWLCMCRKHGWTADAEQVLPGLDVRRAEWRKKRDAGEVALDALMPIEGELEEHWKYYVPQPIPEDAVASAPACVWQDPWYEQDSHLPPRRGPPRQGPASSRGRPLEARGVVERHRAGLARAHRHCRDLRDHPRLVLRPQAAPAPLRAGQGGLLRPSRPAGAAREPPGPHEPVRSPCGTGATRHDRAPA